jgi:hypothetical protein
METSSILSDCLNNAVVAFLCLKTRMTMGSNNPKITHDLENLYFALNVILDETTPEWFSEEEIEWVTEASNFLREMSNNPEWSHLFCEEESDNE